MKNLILVLALSAALYACKKEPSQNITNEFYEIVECDTSHVDTTATDSIPSMMLPAEFQAWADIFEGEGIGAAVNLTEDILILFNLEGDRFAWFEDQEITAVYDLSENNHVLESYPLDNVRAALVMGGNDLYLFDEDGETYAVAYNFDPSQADGSWDDDDFLEFDQETYNIGSGWSFGYDYPFNDIEAAWNYSYDNGTCFDAQADQSYSWLSNGDEVGLFYQPGNYWIQNQELEYWTAENNCGGPDGLVPFEFIGAACRYYKPNVIQEIIFNEDGTQFCYYNVSEGIFSVVYDLY